MSDDSSSDVYETAESIRRLFQNSDNNDGKRLRRLLGIMEPNPYDDTIRIPLNFDDFDDDLLRTVYKNTPLIALQTADYYQRMAKKPVIVVDSDSDTRERSIPVESNKDQPENESESESSDYDEGSEIEVPGEKHSDSKSADAKEMLNIDF